MKVPLTKSQTKSFRAVAERARMTTPEAVATCAVATVKMMWDSQDDLRNHLIDTARDMKRSRT